MCLSESKKRSDAEAVLREVAEWLREDVGFADTGSEHRDRIEALLTKVEAALDGK